MAPYVSPKLYGIIGNPVRHSLSPLLHTTGFQAIGMEAVLLPWKVSPEQLPAFGEAFRILDIQGCCVTIPHKEKVLPLADRASERALAVGAANTLSRRDGEIVADNTDVGGFLAPLERLALSPGTEVLLLGSGGAARAAVVALKELGLKIIRVAGRSHANARRLAAEFTLEPVPWDERGDAPAALIVNSTPLGMKGGLENETPYPAHCFGGGGGLVYDMIYTPLETRLLREAAAAGWRTLSGLDMFIGQADCQFRTWTGHPLPEAAVQAVTWALYGKDIPRRR